MLIVKASYNGETRRFTMAQTTLPSYEQLYNQLYRVFPTGHSYYLSKILFTPSNGEQRLIASEIHTAEEYNRCLREDTTQPWTYGKLRFDVLNEMPHKKAGMLSLSTPQQIRGTVSPSPISQTTTQATAAPCCATSKGKEEVQTLLNKFLVDFGSIMSSTFGDESQPAIERQNRAIGAATPTMPGSFFQQTTPSDIPYPQAGLEAAHPGVWCDYCGRQVRGVRYKCNQCAEYDLCSECVVRQGAKEIHISNCEDAHSFCTIQPPSRSVSSHYPTLVANKPVHAGVECDVCNKQIVGDRHKCLDCANYDLCETCILQASALHPLHEFVKLAEPGRVLVHTVGGGIHKLLHNARCDLCDSQIRGDRYKCTNCPDYDVCERCFVIAPQQHPMHIFMKIKEPSDIMTGRIPEHSVIHPATCDACSKTIIGVRYKCIHPSCPDFDLCMNCEALPIAVHPNTHPLVKIKTNAVTSASLTHLASTASAMTQRNLPAKTPNQVVDEKVAAEPVACEDNGSCAETVGLTMIERTNTGIVSAPDLSLRPVYHATFLSDNNMEDGIVIAPGAEFVKSWKITNNGNYLWPANTELVFVGGDRLAAFDDAPNQYEVGTVNPGDVVDVWAADMKAPDEAGRYVSHWSLRTAEGELFGDKIWCDIVVPELDKEGSNHSGSVVLPTPARANSATALQLGEVEVKDQAGAPEVETTTGTTGELSNTQSINTDAPSLTDGSEAWEGTESIGSAYEHAPAPQGLAQALEYVVLYDSDSSNE